ncbi:MAG: putative glycoside hydrolase, partial [Oscillospiraceae bacterium]
LKSQGGSINYNSKIPLAVDSGAVVSNITLSEMVKAVKSAELIPIAKVSILNDNIAPKFNRNLSYKIENSDSLWFDNNVQSGGKPWISPFEADTQEYISQIAKEISSAGFTQVICTDVAFPEFRQSDITYVGEIVKNANRYETLLNTFNTYKENSEGAQVLLEVSAAKILSGTEEVFVPEKLENTTVAVKFTPTDFEKNIAVDGTEIVLKGVKTYDKVKMIFEKVKAKSAELTIVPCINKQAYSDADLAEAKKALTDLGYKFIIVQ